MNGNDQDLIREDDVFDPRRRRFLQTVISTGALWTLGMSGCIFPGNPSASWMIKADYNKCAGCRTCETVCAAYHNKVTINGETINGPGNPFYARIQVLHFNPDVTIPVVCAMCPDNPCIRTCTSIPDSLTGRKALYRDPVTGAIKHNPAQCRQCGTCAKTCAAEGVGIITSNRATSMPEHLCTLCEGNPQCVARCPQKALSYVTFDPSGEYYRMPPEQLAVKLAKLWYGIG